MKTAGWFCLLVLGFWFMALALACQSGDDDDSTVTADDDAGDDDAGDDSCASCETTGECTDALGAEWGCVDGCCIFFGDDGDDDADDDDDDTLDDDEDFETACADTTNHADANDGEFLGRVVLVQPEPILEGAEQVWRFNVCNMTAQEVVGDIWIGYFNLRLPNQDWEFVVPVPRPDSLQGGVGEWTTDGPQNTDGIPFVEWVFVNQPQYDGGDIREMQYLAFDVQLVSASIVMSGDSFELVLESRDGAGDFSASGSVQIQ